jgi:hypothetical protein
MIRRLTIASGLLTLAVVAALALQDHTLFGLRPSDRGAAPVTAIPDKPPPPAPPIKARPPMRPQPQPLQRVPQARPAAPPAPAASTPHSPVEQVVGIARTLLNLPKVLSGDDQTQVNPSR